MASLREEISGPDPRDLDDEALLTKAHGLYSQKDYADAVRYFEELLKRDLTPTKRGEVLRSLGFSCRMSADHVKSEKVFRKLLAHHGEGTADGMFALYHVAWSRFQQDDAADARDIMDRVASTPHTADVWKIWARANAADFSIKLGDKARARASLESLKADLADDASPTGTRVKAYVEQMLGRLES